MKLAQLGPQGASSSEEHVRLTGKIAELQSEIERLNLKIDGWSDENIDLLQRQSRDAMAAVTTMRQKIDDLIRATGAVDAKIEATSADIKSLDGMHELAKTKELLVEMCGRDGLPYLVLTRTLPVINAEIAKILAGIVKFTVFFEDDPEEQTVSLRMRYGDYKSRPLGLGSGAETFIASLAIRVALLSVSSLPKTDFLIVDEGFGKLDPEHLEALQRMFEYLRTAFKTVFVVSHVDYLKDLVDHSIEITSRDGYAHVEA